MKFDDYLDYTQEQKIELQRYSIEIDALDKRFLIPIDFNAVNEYFVEYNKRAIGYLMDYEKRHGKKIFKYVSYRDMVDIFINGTLKTEQIESKIILSTDGYATAMGFDRAADKYKEFRNEWIEAANKKED